MFKKKRGKLIIGWLSIAVVLGVGLYLFYNTRGQLSFALKLRSQRIPAFFIVGTSTTIATIIFQTMTRNHILSPSIIGLDSLFVFIQTSTIFFFGARSLLITNKPLNFILSVSVMLLVGLGLFYLFFKRYAGRIFLLLMTGVIFGTLMRHLTTFMQAMIDPNEFQSVLAQTLPSFNKIDQTLIVLAVGICTPIIAYLFKISSTLDVLHLGDDYAQNLGVPVQQLQFKLFLLISVLTAVSTALVGPMTFLGFIGANVSYQLLKTYKHAVLLIGGSLITIVILLYSQLIIEHLLPFRTNVGVVIELIGGVYFLSMLLKERSQL
ncbi:iron chelate uptake ABC transporter family permease subunit [Dolosigranulum pigrum]|uniref:iron chelate uptake ABC transporter family permease subunit n=1 Tax=Dolosigranulum pigrum TaxID=29394 RepID=UPI001AD852A3|nr:iron chelate uptake ABC transporter family permease subunit [Dolosigranulum pigrum]QTJ36717.1 iron ABC transporter permease [Dolosigranulum pigrum]